MIFAFGGSVAVRHQPVRGPAHLPRAPDQRQAGAVRVLGLAAGLIGAAITPADGHHPGQGIRRGLKWPLDVLITIVWSPTAGLLRHHRKAAGQAHLRRQLVLRAYVIAVALLHIVNNLAMSFLGCGSRIRSTAARSTRWCSGGTATTAWPSCSPSASGDDVLLRAQKQRPVYSYRLSIVHFWALIFPSTSGPARTTCSAPRCPDWAQSLAWCSRSCCWRPSGAAR